MSGPAEDQNGIGERRWDWATTVLTSQSEYILQLIRLRGEIEGRSVALGHGGLIEVGPMNEKAVRHPPPPELADHLRAIAESAPRAGEVAEMVLIPVPDALLHYVADRLDGTIKLPRGQQHDPEKASREMFEDLYLLWRVRRRQGAYKRIRTTRKPRRANRSPRGESASCMKQTGSGKWTVVNAKARAMERVAKWSGVSVSGLEARFAEASNGGFGPVLDCAGKPVTGHDGPLRPEPERVDRLVRNIVQNWRNEPSMRGSLHPQMRAIFARSSRENHVLKK